MTREDIRAGLIDVNVVALTLWGECRNQPILGQLAVAAVLRNRLNDGRWGGTYKSVCLAKAQFSCWWGDDANSEDLYALGQGLIEGKQSLSRQLVWIAEGLVNGDLEDDPTGGALNYLTEHLYVTHPPTWAQHPVSTVQIGAHVFVKTA